MNYKQVAEQLRLNAPKWHQDALDCLKEANHCQTEANKWSNYASQYPAHAQKYSSYVQQYRENAIKSTNLAKLYQQAANQAYQVAQQIDAQEQQVIEHLGFLHIEMQRCNDPRCFNDACQNILYLIKMYSLMFIKPYSKFWESCGGQGFNN